MTNLFKQARPKSVLPTFTVTPTLKLSSETLLPLRFRDKTAGRKISRGSNVSMDISNDSNFGVQQKEIRSGRGRSVFLTGPVYLDKVPSNLNRPEGRRKAESDEEMKAFGVPDIRDANEVTMSNNSNRVSSLSVTLKRQPKDVRKSSCTISPAPPVMKTSVSVQTLDILADSADAVACSNLPSDTTAVLQAQECCLNLAAKALQKSEEIARSSEVDRMLSDGDEKWDLNSSTELISIISTGELFADGPFGRGSSSSRVL